MAAPYSMDLRRRVLSAHDRGMATKEIAQSFGVSPAWVRRVKQRRRERGETAARPMGGRRHQKIDRVHLAELVAAQPDATLAELRARLGVNCTISAVDAALHGMGLSWKKRRSTPPSRTGPTWRSTGRTGRPRPRTWIRRG